MLMTPETLFSLASSAVLPGWLLLVLFGPIGLLLYFGMRGLLRKRLQLGDV